MINLNGQFQLNTTVCYGDKSLSHRALILASIANGVSKLRNLSVGRDVLATADCLRQLGATILFDGTTATVTPIAHLPTYTVTLNCENSGTTARLLAGLVAGLGVEAKFIGDQSLSKRPMKRVIEPLQALGAKFSYAPDCLFVCHKSHLVGNTVYAKVNSAQVKSAVLLAGLFADGETHYVENISTRNHTELMLAHMGGNITVNGNEITVSNGVLNAIDLTLPNDPSSAAFVVALALAKDVETTLTNVLLNDTRMGFYRILQRSGADLSFVNVHDVFGEKVGDIVVKKSVLTPFIADEHDVCDAIDEIPLLATLALTVKGAHKFSKVSELQHKESNRLQAIEHIAHACNMQCAFDGDNLTLISDGNLPLDKHIHFNSFNDHRIAMCEVVLAIILGGASVNSAPVDVSFPQFFSVLGISPLRFGLIGQSVSNSKSPCLMAHLANRAGVCCSYQTVNLPIDIGDDQLLRVIDSFDGLNVTMPFKARVASLLKAGYPSVNTVGRRIQPQSTDGYGIVKSLLNHGIEPNNISVWIVGAGGAAEACIQQLLEYDCQIQVINRTQKHAQMLVDKYALPQCVPNPVGVLSFVPECEFEKAIILPQSAKFVLIADYKGQSGLKQQAENKKITVIDGLEMLYHQGAKSFALWTDTLVQNDYQSFTKELHNEDTIA